MFGNHAVILERLGRVADSQEHISNALGAQTQAICALIEKMDTTIHKRFDVIRDEIKSIREDQVRVRKNGNGSAAAVKKAGPPIAYAGGGAAVLEIVQRLFGG